MYVRLAVRNVRNSAKDYLIYVITLILSVGLFYGFLSIASPSYHERLPLSMNLSALSRAMRIAIPVVAVLEVFLITYVNTYMLRRKQKEFAVQSIIGMEQPMVAFVFFLETVLMGGMATFFGILLGMLLSQMVSMVVVQSFGEEYQLYFSLFPDTVFITALFFGSIFLIIGLKNIHTIRHLKIIDMLHNSQNVKENAALCRQLFRWVILAAMVSAGAFIMMLALVSRLPLQPSVFWSVFAIMTAAFFFIIAAVRFLLSKRKKSSGSIPLAFMTMLGTAQGTLLLIMYRSFESLVQQGQAIQAYMTMPPILAFLLLGFSIVALFSNLSWLLTKTVKRKSTIYYNHLFLIGQINSRLGSSAKTMGVVTCVLTVSIVLMGWLPVNAMRASEYQKITSPFSVQVLSTYKAGSEEALPKETLDYQYITDYLKERGYPASRIATGQLYLLQKEDLQKKVKGIPLLAISLRSYNQIRALSNLPPISLKDDEFGIAWSHDSLKTRILQVNESIKTIRAGNITLNKAEGADYQDPTGMVLFTSQMQGIYIIPDKACVSLQMATSFYAANTTQPLPYKLAARFDREMLDYQKGLHFFPEDQVYIRLSTLQDNEGISNALLIRLTGSYGAIVLIVICFTILSVQQLTDAIEQKQRFQIIYKLGADKTDQGRYVLQQMVFKFGLPVLVSVIFSMGLLLYLTVTGFEDYIVYVPLDQMMVIFAVVYFVFAAVLVSYFYSTYYLFRKSMEIK